MGRQVSTSDGWQWRTAIHQSRHGEVGNKVTQIRRNRVPRHTLQVQARSTHKETRFLRELYSYSGKFFLEILSAPQTEVAIAETRRILILGGTSDAAALAAQSSLLPGVEVITSLAGRTQQPSTLSGTVRVGGFGGSDGLAAYLKGQQIDLLIDATHPFAAQISWNAATAAIAARIPSLMLVRPAWKKVADDRWLNVDSIEAAAQAIPTNAQRIFLTIGRQQLAPFVLLTGHWFLMRSIDPPDPTIALPTGECLLDRGPFTLENEIALLKQHAIEAIVSKNSGGEATYAKIVAARELELPVIMVQRPARPQGDRVVDVAGAVAWLKQRL